MISSSKTLTALAATTLLLAPQVARAAHERCDFPPGGSTMIAPRDGATAVPRDTLLWLGDVPRQSWDSVTLVEVVGELERIVPLEERGRLEDSAGDVWILGSPVVLRPSTLHRIYRCYTGWCQGLLSTFTTGPDRAAPTPTVPEFLEIDAGSLKEDAYVDITLDQGGVIIIDAPEGDLEPETLRGTVGLVVASADGEFSLDESCDRWPLRKSGGRARVGVYSLTGEFSGWSEPQTFDVPYYSCSVAPPGPAALLLAPLLLLRRRRPRR